jgi:phosphoribosylglycinamide formyltransferase 1
VAERISSLRKCRTAVFASGTGTNFQALIEYQQANPAWPVEIVLLVSDKPECQAVERARQADVPVFAQKFAAYPDKVAFETEILHKLKEYKVEWLVLAGYMRLIGPTLLEAFPGRIVNIHPSLLPLFPGRTAVKDALAAGVDRTGVTVHFVDEGMDTGPVIAQREVPVPPGVTEAELLQQIHKVEHELYPVAIERVVKEYLSACPTRA